MGNAVTGAIAPDFSLDGFTLSQHRGSTQVLVFSDADPSAFEGDGLSAELRVFPAAPDGYQEGVYIVDPAGMLRWAQPGPPSVAEVRSQLLLLLPGPTGGTFQLPPPA